MIEKLKQGSLIAVITGVWGSLHVLTQTLCILIALDFSTGILIAWSMKTICSDISFRGISKKATMLLLVGATASYNATQPLGFDAASAVAGFFCTTEFISILENASKLGVPLPTVIRLALAKIKSELS